MDRNCDAGDCTAAQTASLSARRAWIEIISPDILADVYSVALRKESVDRNRNYAAQLDPVRGSLSARRAWIEIAHPRHGTGHAIQSLSARRAWIEIRRRTYQQDAKQESLSARRAWIEIKYVVKDSNFAGCRSPQGERG